MGCIILHVAQAIESIGQDATGLDVVGVGDQDRPGQLHGAPVVALGIGGAALLLPGHAEAEVDSRLGLSMFDCLGLVPRQVFPQPQGLLEGHHGLIHRTDLVGDDRHAEVCVGRLSLQAALIPVGCEEVAVIVQSLAQATRRGKLVGRASRGGAGHWC